jgi:hypothetical protein
VSTRVSTIDWTRMELTSCQMTNQVAASGAKMAEYRPKQGGRRCVAFPDPWPLSFRLSSSEP